jgi:hypothetical protein
MFQDWYLFSGQKSHCHDKEFTCPVKDSMSFDECDAENFPKVEGRKLG